MRKTGTELFHINAEPLPVLLQDFWQWFGSDLLNNALRGILAEFIVASDLGCSDSVRQEWNAYDLETRTGFKVEVKSAAYLQSWRQEKLSLIRFNIAPTYEQVNEEDGRWKQSDVSKRQADVYVFCVLSHQDKETIDPLNMAQWDFYVLPAKILNERAEKQKSIYLSALLKLEPKQVRYGEIARAIDELMNTEQI
jgi:hypothetical protein